MRKKTILSTILLLASFLLVSPSYAGCLGGRCGPLKRIAVRRAQRGKSALSPRFRAKALRDCGVSGGGRRVSRGRRAQADRVYAGQATPIQKLGSPLTPPPSGASAPIAPAPKPIETPGSVSEENSPTPSPRGTGKAPQTPSAIAPVIGEAVGAATGSIMGEATKAAARKAAEKVLAGAKDKPLPTSTSLPDLKSALEKVVHSRVDDTFSVGGIEMVKKKHSINGKEYLGVVTSAGAVSDLGSPDQVVGELLERIHHRGDLVVIEGATFLLGAPPNPGDTRGRSIYDSQERLLGYTNASTFSDLLEKAEK